MKKTFKLKSLLLSMAVAGATTFAVAPTAVQAEVSYNASVSNMYLWRGINISNPSPVVSGGVDYSHDSGLYVGAWTSSEGYFDGSSEIDLYGGYAFEVGGLGVDLGYAAYLYPSAGEEMFTNISETDGTMITEVIVGLSFADFSATAYINTEGDDVDNYKYLSLGYGIGDVGLHFGKTMSDDSDSEYTDMSVSYSATDALSFTLSKASGDGAIGIAGDGAENVNLQVSYDLPI